MSDDLKLFLAEKIIERQKSEIAAYKALLFQAQTERDVARATVCISPWEDSPPCKGIQKQLDKIAALKTVLHNISLGSQNSMTTKENLGAEARRALAALAGEE
jgi:hypothetical protein